MVCSLTQAQTTRITRVQFTAVQPNKPTYFIPSTYFSATLAYLMRCAEGAFMASGSRQSFCSGLPAGSKPCPAIRTARSRAALRPVRFLCSGCKWLEIVLQLSLNCNQGVGKRTMCYATARNVQSAPQTSARVWLQQRKSSPSTHAWNPAGSSAQHLLPCTQQSERHMTAAGAQLHAR
jgi:hypothetical protein